MVSMTNQEDLQGMVNRTAESAGEYAGIFADPEPDPNAEPKCCGDCPDCECPTCWNCGPFSGFNDSDDNDEREPADPLEIKWEYSQGGGDLILTKITLVTGTGGPHIEIVTNHSHTEAVGYWAGCEPAHAYIAQEMGERIWDYFEELDPVAMGIAVRR